VIIINNKEFFIIKEGNEYKIYLPNLKFKKRRKKKKNVESEISLELLHEMNSK